MNKVDDDEKFFYWRQDDKINKLGYLFQLLFWNTKTFKVKP